MRENTLMVKDVFESIQGEGSYLGLPVVFVRFVGCNLNCEWCDTKKAKYGGVEVNIEDLSRQIKWAGIDTVVLTGGEPFYQGAVDTVFLDFLDNLVNNGKEVHVETNGTFIPDENTVNLIKHYSVSPKLESANSGDTTKWEHQINIWNYIAETNEVTLKFVISKTEDLREVKRILRGVYPEELNFKDIIIQPEFGRGVDFAKILVKIISSYSYRFDTKVRIIPQVHKLLQLK